MRSRFEKHRDRMRLQQIATLAKEERRQAELRGRDERARADAEYRQVEQRRERKAARRREVTLAAYQQRMDFITERLEESHPEDTALADAIIIRYVLEHGRVHSSWLNAQFRALGLHPQTYSNRWSALSTRGVLEPTGDYLPARDPAAGNPNKQLQVWKAGELLHHWRRQGGVATIENVQHLLDEEEVQA